jgi:hypothetical protein
LWISANALDQCLELSQAAVNISYGKNFIHHWTTQAKFGNRFRSKLLCIKPRFIRDIPMCFAHGIIQLTNITALRL